jgi:uncharacterized protein (TIGR04255 family)
VTNLPELAHPPIAEVVYGMGFKPLPLLKSAHLGLFWSRYRDRYVTAEDMLPVVEPPVAGAPVAVIAMGMPRVWFVDATKTRLLQLQADRLFMNWRQTKPDDEYPRFPALYKDFGDFTHDFAQFLKEQNVGELSPTTLELGYINQIYERDGLKLPADVGRVFKPLAWNRDAYQRLSDPSELAWRASFVRSSGIKVNAQAAMGIRQSDSAPVLQLDIRAVSQFTGGALESALTFYPLAHEEVVLGFFDLTPEEAQKTFWS